MASLAPPSAQLHAESEARLRALLEAAVDAIVTIDEGGLIQLVNPAAENLFGYSAGELIGQNVSLLMPSPYREEHDGYLARYLKTGERRIIGIRREVAAQRKDGTTVPVEISVAEARRGDWRGFVGVIHDLSKRKATAELFRLVVESAPNAILISNAAGEITLANVQAERYFGYLAGELIGQPIETLVPERFRSRHASFRKEFLAAPAARPMGAGRDLYGRRKDGSEFPVEIGLTPIQTSEGVQVLSAIVDITERKAAEAALRRSHEELEKLVADLRAKEEEVRMTTQQLWQAAKLASVGELAASIAHEINNPLATVALRVESTLARTPDDDPRRRALEIIAQETKRMGDLVANLLQFSRSGRDESSTVDVRQELVKAVDLVHHHLRKRQIVVRHELAADTPIIYADRQKLRQVFLNLLSNASDAMSSGGALTVRTERALLAGDRPAVRIEVRDSGIGIPAEHLQKVMEPFFTTKDEGKGTGLGLAICRRIVQEHQGHIEIASEVGKGTTILLTLPVKSDVNAAALVGAASP